MPFPFVFYSFVNWVFGTYKVYDQNLLIFPTFFIIIVLRAFEFLGILDTSYTFFRFEIFRPRDKIFHQPIHKWKFYCWIRIWYFGFNIKNSRLESVKVFLKLTSKKLFMPKTPRKNARKLIWINRVSKITKKLFRKFWRQLYRHRIFSPFINLRNSYMVCLYVDFEFTISHFYIVICLFFSLLISNYTHLQSMRFQFDFIRCIFNFHRLSDQQMSRFIALVNIIKILKNVL